MREVRDTTGLVTSLTFDIEGATKAGLSRSSVALANELAQFTNELIRLGPNMFKVNLADYPLVKSYFEEAAIYEKKNISSSAIAQGTAVIESVELAPTPIAQSICGYYLNPKPTVGQTYRFWGPYSDPQAVATSWGYHPPPPGMGDLGWTRPQTWTQCPADLTLLEMKQFRR
jgi:hypothetical protein